MKIRSGKKQKTDKMSFNSAKNTYVVQSRPKVVGKTPQTIYHFSGR
jgi:hypothetical protein